MKNTRKLVNPVHFFDERGHHVSRVDTLEAEVKALRARNERLEAMLQAVKRRAALDTGDVASTANTTFH